MSSDRLKYLMQAWAAKMATEPEKRELFGLMAEEWERVADVPEIPIDWERVFQRIIEARNHQQPAIGTQTRIRRIRRQATWAAAALILLLAGAGLWRFHAQKPGADPGAAQTLHPSPDLNPGGNKAILTLAGGKQIVLDTVSDGAITRQGESLVSKAAGKQLSYLTSAGSHPPSGELIYNTLTTPRGGQYQLILPDGSKVWLNAASSITYPTAFTGKERRVTVTGEAYFEVVHRPRQPFYVETGGGEIRDIGTAFNINAYNDEPASKVTLIEGAVEIEHAGQRLLLQPGQQGAFTPGGLALQPQPDLETVLAWKNGLFQFNHAGIADIMRQVARWYDVDITYEGNVLEEHFSGSMPRTSRASELLHLLELTKTLRFTIEGKKIIVKPYTR